MGLLVFVMGRDSTNRGVTHGMDAAVLMNAEGPFTTGDGLNGKGHNLPGLVLVVDESPTGLNVGHLLVAKPTPEERASGSYRVHRVRAVPLDDDGNPLLGGMFGGHFVETSDSRFPYTGPVPVFDRFE